MIRAPGDLARTSSDLPWQCPRCGRWQAPTTPRCDCTPDPPPPQRQWPDPYDNVNRPRVWMDDLVHRIPYWDDFFNVNISSSGAISFS